MFLFQNAESALANLENHGAAEISIADGNGGERGGLREENEGNVMG
jgi:hypothetical protein